MGVCGKDHWATEGRKKEKKGVMEQLLRLHRRAFTQEGLPGTRARWGGKGHEQTALLALTGMDSAL